MVANSAIATFLVLIGTARSSGVMSRIAAPIIGGMITAPLLSMLVLPAAFRLLHRRSVKGGRNSRVHPKASKDNAVLLDTICASLIPPFHLIAQA
jgi:hypothetical protein